MSKICTKHNAHTRQQKEWKTNMEIKKRGGHSKQKCNGSDKQGLKNNINTSFLDWTQRSGKWNKKMIVLLHSDVTVHNVTFLAHNLMSLLHMLINWTSVM